MSKHIKKETDPDLSPKDSYYLHYDDSSDEEDNYVEMSELEFGKALDTLAKINPNIDRETLETAFILEDQGRRVIYDTGVRKNIMKKREQCYRMVNQS